MPWSPAARRMRWSFAILTAIGILLIAAVFIDASNEIDRIRGDFCTWTGQHYTVDLHQQQTPARQADERSDRQLEHKLGCG